MSDEYVKDEEILETRWKCPTCEVDNRGRDMTCRGCGAPKDESSEYVLDDSAAVVTDEELVRDAEAGEHWLCAYCEKQNRGRKDVCRFCGADQTLKERGEPAPPPLPKKRKPSVLLGCGVLLALGVGFVLLAYWVGSMGRVEAKVSSLKWEQRVHLHERTLMNGEGWRDEVPGDAFDSACKRQQRTTRQVVDRYRTVSRTREVRYQSGTREDCHEVTKNLANGYAKRQTVCKSVPEYDYRTEHYTEKEPVYRTEPVYEEYCRYKRYDWPVVRTAKRQGEGKSNYEWPPTSEVGADTCTDCTQKGSGVTRCCSQEGLYTVVFERTEASDDGTENAVVNYPAASVAEFETFTPGDAHVLSISDEKVEIIRE